MRQAYLLFVISFHFVSAQETENIQAKINLFQKDIFVMIDAVVQNNNHIYKNKLNYHLLSLKKEANSKTYTKEDRFGEFNLLPNEKKTITSLKLNMDSGHQLKVYLFIKDGKQNLIKSVGSSSDELEIIALEEKK